MKTIRLLSFAALLGLSALAASSASAAIYTKEVSGAFRTKVEEVAKNLKVDADHLVAVMALETATPSGPKKGTPTFDPAIKNPSSNAVGLIQFMPKTAQALLLPTQPKITPAEAVEAFAKMTAVEQMKYVEIFLKDSIGARKVTRLVDLYAAVFLPVLIGKPLTEELEEKYAKQNMGFDKNGDGKVTVQEISDTIQHFYDKGK
jgi:hypothetical protein